MINLLNTEQNNCDYHLSHCCAALFTQKNLELQNSMNKLKICRLHQTPVFIADRAYVSFFLKTTEDVSF